MSIAILDTADTAVSGMFKYYYLYQRGYYENCYRKTDYELSAGFI